MSFNIEAACLCNTGHRRKNNEDNFWFNGNNLPMENNGLNTPLILQDDLCREMCFSVFDGMGGENFGEAASFTAADNLAAELERSSNLPPEERLATVAVHLNDAVVAAAKERLTAHMGSTMVSLLFHGSKATVCNLGDSRAYLLRNGQLKQLSTDHVSTRPMAPGHKAPLTQHLGIDPEEFLIAPSSNTTALCKNDVFLLCSDGVTDMIPEAEIQTILSTNRPAAAIVTALVERALELGGRDNITAIVIKVDGEPAKEKAAADVSPRTTAKRGKVLLLVLMSAFICAAAVIAVFFIHTKKYPTQKEWTEWSTSLPEYVDTRYYRIEEKKQFAYRDKEITGPEYSPEKSGWELESSSIEQQDGEWSQWSESQPAMHTGRKIESKIQYRMSMKETARFPGKDVTADGWILDPSEPEVRHGEWSEWDLYSIEVAQMYGLSSMRIPGSFDDLSAPNGSTAETYDIEITKGWASVLDAGTGAICSPVRPEEYDSKGPAIFKYVDIFHMRKNENLYSYHRYGDWTEWVDEEITASSDILVDHRTVYRYCDPVPITVYYFSRWTPWSPYTFDEVTETDTRDVDVRTVFRFISK